MLLTILRNGTDFIEKAFYDADDEEFDPRILSAKSTEIRFENPSSGFVTTLTGSGLPTDPEDDGPLTGTLTGIAIRNAANQPVATFTGMNWPFGEFVGAMEALLEYDNSARLDALFSGQDVTVDARGAIGPVDARLDGITANLTVHGSNFNDTIEGGGGNDRLNGGNGNDYIIARDSNSGPVDEDVIDTGLGNDTIDAAGVDRGYLEIRHDSIGGPIAVTIDGAANSGSIAKTGGGTTTLLNIVSPMQADGLGVAGTAGNDSFDVNVAGWTQVKGGMGADSYTLGGWGGIRLTFNENSTQGMQADLAAGTIANDGFGNAETITLRPSTETQPVRVEIRATDHADTIMGSDRSESFILQAGNDVLDGGGGWDVLRYDRSGLSGIDADLETGLVTGTWGGQGFRHQVSNIHEIRGTSDNDNIAGASGTGMLRGLGGNDVLHGDGADAAMYMPQALQAYRLYQATLGRAPDDAGHLDWTLRLAEDGASLQDAAGGFTGSREFQKTYGALDNEGFVQLLYQNVLDRAADAGGLADWTGRLDGGMTRAEVVLGFSESREFIRTTLADAASYVMENAASNWTDEVFRLYRATLDRAPDAAGLIDWAGRLAGDMDLQGAADGFTGSREFQKTYGALDDEGFVQLLYQNVLDRAADAGGLADWTGRLAAGTSRAEVVLGFSESREFVNATAPQIKAWATGLDYGLMWGAHDEIVGGAGNNVLSGGLLSDHFVFDRNDGAGSDHVLDLEAWDHVSFRNFGYSDPGHAIGNMMQDGDDVRFSNMGRTVVFEDTHLADITPDMIWI